MPIFIGIEQPIYAISHKFKKFQLADNVLKRNNGAGIYAKLDDALIVVGWSNF